MTAIKLIAPPGAPPVPLGFGAIAGEAAAAGSAAAAASSGGGIGTAAIVGGIAVAGGVAALAASGGSDSTEAGAGTGGGSNTTPGSTPDPAPTPAPTPEPDADTRARAVGRERLVDRDAGRHRHRHGRRIVRNCGRRVPFTAARGNGPSGNPHSRLPQRRYVRRGNVGLSRELQVDGTLDGSTIVFAARRDSTQGIVSADLIGTVDSGRMSGTFVAVAAGGATGSGVWSLDR